MNIRGSVIVGTVAALALACAPAGAKPHHGHHHGDKPTRWNVEYEGSGTYQVVSTFTDGGGEESAAYNWDVHYTPLFIGPAGEIGAATDDLTSKGGGTWSVSSHDAESSCTQTGGFALIPLGGIVGTRGGKGVNLILVPGAGDFVSVNATNADGACNTDDFWHDWVQNFSLVGVGEDDSFDPLTSFAHISNRDLKKHGKIVIKTSNHTLAAPSLTIPADCGGGGGSSCTQTFDWTATVTLTKKGHKKKHHHH
jgi:hypothetical protein